LCGFEGELFFAFVLDSPIASLVWCKYPATTFDAHANIHYLQAQCDLQHLWHGRRASTRIRVELIAAVYDKALKRKDFSGLVDKDKAREAAERKAESQSTSPKATQTKAQKQAQKAKAEKADDPKAGADTGKIVNLMAGDQTRVSTIVSGAYNIYGAPIEILVGSAFLYELLGCVLRFFFPRTP
jgi:hypothetical protein